MALELKPLGTAAPSLAWLNRVQAIGRGMSKGDVAEFEMYEVA